MAISNPSGNYIDKVTLPTGSIYTIVDADARQAIDNMASYTSFLGVVSDTRTPITDGSTTAAVLIGSTTVTAVTGNIAIYKASTTATAQEFIFDGTKWQFFGDISAQNLGSLAYKNSASSSSKFLTGVSVTNTSTTAISVTGSYAKINSVTLTKSGVTISLATTTTAPSNTANYWVYNPADNLSITASAPGVASSTSFLTGVTGRTLLSSLTHAAPTTATVTGGVNYTSVDGHNLQLRYLVTSSSSSISGTTSNTAVKSISAPTINKSGTTRYVAPVSVTVATAVGFGTTATTLTSSGVQKIASIGSTSATVTVS